MQPLTHFQAVSLPRKTIRSFSERNDSDTELAVRGSPIVFGMLSGVTEFEPKIKIAV
jgi:hypothetical protein